MFRLFGNRKSGRTAPRTTRLALESLDRRDVPSAVLGTYDDQGCGNVIEVKFPNRGGCWPGPAPDVAVGAISIVNSVTDSVARPVAPADAQATHGIIVIGSLPGDALGGKVAADAVVQKG